MAGPWEKYAQARAPSGVPVPQSKPQLVPFDPSIHTPRDIGLGGPSTEYLVTESAPDGGFWNVPSIWWGQDGEPHLMDTQQAVARAREYEAETGNVFPRFPTPEAGVEAAKARSSEGGASTAPLAETQAEEPRRPGKLGFVNRSIASMAGAPVDLVAAALGAMGVDTGEAPIGGSESFRRGMGAISADVAPEGMAAEGYGERAAEGLGLAAGMLIPGAGAVGTLGRGGNVARGVAETVKRPFVATPKRAMAIEGFAGAGAGAGGLAAERNAEELGVSPEVARVAGEMVAGLGAAAAPGMGIRALGHLPMVNAAGSAAAATVAPFTKAGGMELARRRVQSLAGDAGQSAERIQEGTIGGLTSSQATGDPRLMALEREVRRGVAPLEDEFAARSRQSLETLGEDMAAIPGGARPDQTRAFLEANRAKIRANLDRTVADAEARAGQAVEAMSPQMRESEASVAFRNEMEGALRQARAEESRLWGEVPKELTGDTSNATAAFKSTLDEVGAAQRDKMPDVAKRFLDEQSNAKFGDNASVKDLHSLHSALKEEARQARAAGEFQTARMAEKVADGVMADIDAVQGAQPAFDAARQYTREFHKKFSQGTTGKILGYAAEGGDKVAPEITLRQGVGPGGVKSAVAVDDLMRAAEGRPDAQAAMTDYMRRRFMESAAPRGTLDRGRAQDFLRKNAELMERFPELRAQLNDAIRMNDDASAMRAITDEGIRAANDPRQSPAAAFTGADYGKEFGSILGAQDPRTAARRLVSAARTDPTGEALGGLKAAAVDHLTDKVMTGSGVKEGGITAMLKDRRSGPALREVLSPEEIVRLQRIERETDAVRASMGNLPEIGGAVSTDMPNRLIDYIVGTAAVRQGAKLGAGTSGASLRTSAMTSSQVKRLLQWLTKDRASEIIREAVLNDPDLYVDLLTRGGTPKADARINRRITEWLAAETGIGIDAAGGRENEPPWAKYGPQ